MLFGLYVTTMVVAVGFLGVRAASLMAKGRSSFRIYITCFGILLGYLLAELAVTSYSRVSWIGTSLFLFEESGKTIHFDPVRGYILTTEPSRWVRITNGTVEYVGQLKGNSEGFPTHSDFRPKQTNGITRRIAIFGDSFSAGEYLRINWPDQAQALARAQGDQLQLLNFSVDGAGLANWWSILIRYVQVQNFDLDGIIFVVFEENLERKFVVAEHRGYQRHMFGRCNDWDPDTYPITLDQARTCMHEVEGAYIVSNDEFEHALHGQWPLSIPRPPLRPVIAGYVSQSLTRLLRPQDFAVTTRAPQFSAFEPGQLRLIEDIRRFVTDRGLPVFVAFLPSRDRLMASTWQTDAWRTETKAFAATIGGSFLDGSGAFTNMEPRAIRQCFLPYDHHWNQAGSDRFARYMLDQIRRSFPKR